MYQARGGHLVRLLDLDVNAITIEDVRDYCKQRLKEHADRETIRKELVTLRRALQVAKEHGHYLGDPRTPTPKWSAKYVPRKRWLSHEEARQLLAALPNERHRLWVTLALYTGARYSEISGIRWSHIDLRRGTILLPGTKTQGAHRTIPLPAPLRAALPERPARDEPVAGEWPKVVRDLGRACERAGIPRVSPNDLRRTYASWLKQQGEDSFVVAQLLGHTSSRMVELVYGRLDHLTLAKAVRSLPAGLDVGQLWDRNGGKQRKQKTQRKAVAGDSVDKSR
jgi:integrase